MKVKKIQVLIIIFLLALTTSATASDHINRLDVKAFDRGIEVTIDGKEVKLSNTPLIIDGQVMLSARDVAQILGKAVVWSGNYNLVNFASKTKVLDFPSDTQVLAAKPPTIVPKYSYMEKMKVLRNVGPFYQLAKRKIAIAGTRYNNGVVVDLTPSENPPAPAKAEVKILLNGNYTGLDGFVGVEDGAMNSKNGFTLRIYNDGVLRYETALIEPGDVAYHLSKDAVGNLTGVKILKIEIETQTIESGLGNAKVIAALANFKLYRRY